MKKIFFISLILLFTGCASVQTVVLVDYEKDKKEKKEIKEIKEIKETESIITIVKEYASAEIIEKPYQINGKWFYPKDYNFFEEIGIAKPILDLQNGDRTKNNETFRQEMLIGAHRSLALPSKVRVTNISNGYSVIVRINHRGAFSNINTINLSKGVFNKLELNKTGGLVKISLIPQNETFILNEAFIYEEEKKVTDAPVSTVTIGSIESSTVINSEDEIDELVQTEENNLDGFKVIEDFKYNQIYINVATFFFEESAIYLKSLLPSNYKSKVAKYKNVQNQYEYRVIIGPFINTENLIEVLNNDTINKYEDLSIFLI